VPAYLQGFGMHEDSIVSTSLNCTVSLAFNGKSVLKIRVTSKYENKLNFGSSLNFNRSKFNF